MIVCTESGVFVHGSDDVVRGLLYEARPCPCGKMSFFVVNRDGRTRCVDCDMEYVQRLQRHVNS